MSTMRGGQVEVDADIAGRSSKWKWPDVEGIENFRGTLIHTAAWPENFDYANKRVAVIGNGASGVQVLPAIQPGEQWSPKPRYTGIERRTDMIGPQMSRSFITSSEHQLGSHHHGGRLKSKAVAGRCSRRSLSMRRRTFHQNRFSSSKRTKNSTGGSSEALKRILQATSAW